MPDKGKGKAGNEEKKASFGTKIKEGLSKVFKGSVMSLTLPTFPTPPSPGLTTRWDPNSFTSLGPTLSELGHRSDPFAHHSHANLHIKSESNLPRQLRYEHPQVTFNTGYGAKSPRYASKLRPSTGTSAARPATRTTTTRPSSSATTRPSIGPPSTLGGSHSASNIYRASIMNRDIQSQAAFRDRDQNQSTQSSTNLQASSTQRKPQRPSTSSSSQHPLAKFRTQGASRSQPSLHHPYPSRRTRPLTGNVKRMTPPPQSPQSSRSTTTTTPIQVKGMTFIPADFHYGFGSPFPSHLPGTSPLRSASLGPSEEKEGEERRVGDMKRWERHPYNPGMGSSPVGRAEMGTSGEVSGDGTPPEGIQRLGRTILSPGREATDILGGLAEEVMTQLTWTGTESPSTPCTDKLSSIDTPCQPDDHSEVDVNLGEPTSTNLGSDSQAESASAPFALGPISPIGISRQTDSPLPKRAELPPAPVFAFRSTLSPLSTHSQISSTPSPRTGYGEPPAPPPSIPLPDPPVRHESAATSATDLSSSSLIPDLARPSITNLASTLTLPTHNPPRSYIQRLRAPPITLPPTPPTRLNTLPPSRPPRRIQNRVSTTTIDQIEGSVYQTQPQPNPADDDEPDGMEVLSPDSPGAIQGVIDRLYGLPVDVLEFGNDIKGRSGGNGSRSGMGVEVVGRIGNESVVTLRPGEEIVHGTMDVVLAPRETESDFELEFASFRAGREEEAGEEVGTPIVGGAIEGSDGVISPEGLEMNLITPGSDAGGEPPMRVSKKAGRVLGIERGEVEGGVVLSRGGGTGSGARARAGAGAGNGNGAGAGNGNGVAGEREKERKRGWKVGLGRVMGGKSKNG